MVVFLFLSMVVFLFLSMPVRGDLEAVRDEDGVGEPLIAVSQGDATAHLQAGLAEGDQALAVLIRQR